MALSRVVVTGCYILLAQNDGENVLFRTRICMIRQIQFIGEKMGECARGCKIVWHFQGLLGVFNTHATSTHILRVKMTSNQFFLATLAKEQLENVPT